MDWILHESKVLRSPCLNVLNSDLWEQWPLDTLSKRWVWECPRPVAAAFHGKWAFRFQCWELWKAFPNWFFFFFLWWLLYPLATQAYFLIELDPSNFQTKWISEVPKGWTLWKIHSLHVVTEGTFLLSQLHSEYWNVIFITNAVFPDGFFFRFARYSQKDKFLLLKNFFEFEIN